MFIITLIPSVQLAYLSETKVSNTLLLEKNDNGETAAIAFTTGVCIMANAILD